LQLAAHTGWEFEGFGFMGGIEIINVTPVWRWRAASRSFFQFMADHFLFANSGGTQDIKIITIVFDADTEINGFHCAGLANGFGKIFKFCGG
jgi:hypothetical protein